MNDAPVVRTASGLVRGMRREDSLAFLGIPFAQPPVGERRFAAPVPMEPWEGIRDATTFGATAQRGDTGFTLIPEPSVPGDSTLNVNVFTPAALSDTPLPVLVWIHGGGFTSGTPSSPWYDGGTFARDGVVLVALSYRLGFDGFGDIVGAPSNRGVRDWIAGLEWVQENIAAFGGDPDRVTIGGQSAGGGAVLTLLGMPAAQHLFHAAWSVSGALGDVPAADARARAVRLADLVGVEPTRSGFESVAEEHLRDLQERAAHMPRRDKLVAVREMLAGLSWGPMIDGDLLVRSTRDALAAGIGADKPLLLGAADDEFTMVTARMRRMLRWVPPGLGLRALGVPASARRRYLRANPGPRRGGSPALLGRYVTDRIFRALVSDVAALRAEAPAPTWVYRFSWASPVIGWACHCLDVPFWFDALGESHVAAIAGDHPPAALATAMHGTAVGFVRSRAAAWPRWSASDKPTRVFGGSASAPEVIPDGYAGAAALA
ncbi:carboxylesterase/lipase family protein [Microbacterium sp. cx-59]|uniref:carboxylesterase/lipase family protein n=1 Tax=Microbacterium sp. cx-59 TaxID=2891207 RepID=UPI001E642662|nr:carboxylesterase family protein [Microbacterium sp. cx-59]MCC4909275.1 carboxylesterase family protein [Microbacterium sp. cx-59]